MNLARRETESRFLEQVALYKEEYRASRAAALQQERERQHAGGEVYFAVCWVSRSDAPRLVQAFERQERLTLIEAAVLLIVVFAGAWLVWRLFVLLFLPLPLS